MPKLIFVNLPVSDLPAAVAFYKALGARQELKFSDDTAACMVFSETIHAMLLTHDKWRTFTRKPIADRSTSEVLICVSEESRDAVDAVADRANAAGGGTDPVPLQDYGFMYSRSFEDLDGHVWEVMWMDPTAAEQGAEAIGTA